MKKLTLASYGGIVAALFAVEAAFFLDEYSPWKRYAGLFWIVCSAVIMLSAFAAAFTPFMERRFWSLPHKGWYLTAFFLPPALILMNVGGTSFTPVDGEGLAQLAGGMKLLRYDPSFGVFTLSYYSYMARQYLLNSLPSHFFGPSLLAARLGNSMFYIGSYGFFLSALAAFLRSRKIPDALFFSSYCGLLIALGQYTLLNARKFEQTTMPIAVTLFFLGALLLFLVERGPLNVLWLTWSFGFMTECYTPALGTWVLALAALAYLIVWKRQRVLIPVVAYGLACFYVAYRIVKNDDEGSIAYRFRYGLGQGTASDWVFRYLHGMRAMIGSDYAVIPAPLALALFAAVGLAWRFRDYRYGVVCGWAVVIAFISMTTFGSNLNLPYYDVQRTMIILPPLALGTVGLIIRFMSAPGETPAASRMVKIVMRLSMVYMVYTGICTVFLVRSFFGSAIRSDYDEVFVKIDALATSPTAVHPKRIYLVPPLDVILEPGLKYFAPDAEVVRSAPPAGEKIPGTYVFSYLTDNPDDRVIDQRMPSLHARPFVKMVPE